MSKIRRIHDFQHSFTFSSQSEQFDTYYARFLESDLGKIYIAVPWDEIVGAFGLKEYKKGPRFLFSSKGSRPWHSKKRHRGHRTVRPIGVVCPEIKKITINPCKTDQRPAYGIKP
tara:strand:- start:17903 stop:18247 length:345 start_codon:yes stop_codon:yes gene_type:complete